MEKIIDLSLILPCYNEESIFKDSMQTITQLLNKTKYNYEIILIDDQSKDNTPNLIKEIAKINPNIEYRLHTKNAGRGGVVMEGLKIARGKIAGYIDIDLEVPVENILSHALAIENGYEITYANRITKFEWHNIHRHIMHSIYIGLQKFLLQTKFNDTNAGCKFFNREKILPILNECKETHWFWDTEILIRSYFHNLKLKELPALYIPNSHKKSTVKKMSDTWYFIKKTMEFRKIINQLKQ
ncbi:MAG: glycosyltransferase [Candidatus Diapherotrites archaeon]|nr:glycosyltransferase [Candidatus Diapherotrites archaeon]